MTQKELQIKMSSFLNVSNANSKPEEFSLKDIEVFVDSEEQNWLKRAHVGKILGIEDRNGLEKCEMLARKDIKAVMGGLPGPKDQQNKTDIFLSKRGLLYVINKCRKPTHNLKIQPALLGLSFIKTSGSAKSKTPWGKSCRPLTVKK